jgi:hypothetical protein
VLSKTSRASSVSGARQVRPVALRRGKVREGNDLAANFRNKRMELILRVGKSGRFWRRD